MDTKLILVPLGPAARQLGVPAKWLREEAEAERLPHLKAGNRFLFDLDRVAAILRERATGKAASHA